MALEQSCLHIEKKRAENSVNNVTPDGHFEGYASLFGMADLSNDVVEKGAFYESLKPNNMRPIRMLFQHDPDQPIGSWLTLIEDKKGLLVKGQLNLEVARARDVHALMLSGSLDGLSIGFKTLKSRQNKATGMRHILKADLWEISVVTFPMLMGARVEQVKANSETFFDFDKKLAADIRIAARRI